MPDPTPGNVTPPGTDTPWFAGFDDTTKSHMVAKGYDKLDAAAAFQAAHQAYKEAESKLGIPADRVLKLPDTTDSEGWKAVHEKLGVPKEPAGYDLSGVKDVPDATANWVRENALKLNLTQTAAAGLAAALQARDAQAASDKRVANAAVLAAEQAQLDVDWGGNKARNEFLAQRAYAMLGYTPSEFEALKQEPGFSNRMKGLVSVATKMGEAELVGGDAGGGGGGMGGKVRMSPDEAVSRLDDIKAGRDKDFARRYYHGNPAEKAEAATEWKALTELVARSRMAVPSR